MNFWELIPNITSPLAALCFIFYLLYQYKSKEDEKIERILSLSNPKVQKEAADKLLREHPDVELAPINNQKSAVELAKEIIANKLKKYNKTANSLLICTGIFAITFLFSQLINNQNVESNKELKDVKEKDLNSWSLKEASKKNILMQLEV